MGCSILLHTIPSFNDLKEVGFGKYYGGKGENAGNQHFLLFPKCFQLLSERHHHLKATFNLSSANAFNSVLSKNLSSACGAVVKEAVNTVLKVHSDIYGVERWIYKGDLLKDHQIKLHKFCRNGWDNCSTHNPECYITPPVACLSLLIYHPHYTALTKKPLMSWV